MLKVKFNLANVLKVASFVLPLLKRKKKDEFEQVDPFQFVTTLESYDEKIEYIDATIKSLNILRETYVKMGAYEIYIKTKQENERA